MKKIAVAGVPGGWSSELLADVIKEKTGFRALVDLESVVMDLENDRVFNEDVNLHECDAVIVKKAGPYYSPNLLDRLEMLRYLKEKLGVPVFSDPTAIIRVLDRLACTTTLRVGDIPMPPTAVTESVDRAVDFVESYGRAIFKPLFSTKARGMEVIEAGPECRAKVEAFKQHNDVIYLQKMVDNPGEDLGVMFLGGEYLATYARVGSGKSWDTTTRTGGKYEPREPGPEVIEMARKAQALFGLDFTSVDVVQTPDGPMCYEVSAFGGFRGLRDANNINAAEMYVDYVLGKIS